VFSDQLLQQFDTDQDGAFSAAENQQIAATTLPSLANFHYFTYAWVDGKDLGRLEPSDFHASVLGHRQIAGRLAGGGRLGGLLALLGPILITSIGAILLAGALLDQGPY
jgi:hypothetical protein